MSGLKAIGGELLVMKAILPKEDIRSSVNTWMFVQRMNQQEIAIISLLHALHMCETGL